MSLALLAFVLTEHQWDSTLLNWQHILSELGFYSCIVLVMYLCSVGLHDSNESDALGWTLIILVQVVMAINIVCIIVSYLIFCKLKCRRCYAPQSRSRRLGRRLRKIVPIGALPESSDLENMDIAAFDPNDIENPLFRKTLERLKADTEAEEEKKAVIDMLIEDNISL